MITCPYFDSVILSKFTRYATDLSFASVPPMSPSPSTLSPNFIATPRFFSPSTRYHSFARSNSPTEPEWRLAITFLG